MFIGTDFKTESLRRIDDFPSLTAENHSKNIFDFEELTTISRIAFS